MAVEPQPAPPRRSVSRRHGARSTLAQRRRRRRADRGPWADPDPLSGRPHRLRRRLSSARGGETNYRVIETGRGERLRRDTRRQTPVGTGTRLDREPLEVPRGTPITSLIILPLVARGRTLGAFSLGLGPSERAFRPEDIALATELGSRAAIALDNALLYRNDPRSGSTEERVSGDARTRIAQSADADHERAPHHGPAGSPMGERLGWARKVIGRQVRLLGRLVDDLLDVSRITQGKIVVACSEMSTLAEVVAAAVETARPFDRRKAASFHHDAARKIPANGGFREARAGPRQFAEQRRQVHRTERVASG